MFPDVIPLMWTNYVLHTFIYYNLLGLIICINYLFRIKVHFATQFYKSEKTIGIEDEETAENEIDNKDWKYLKYNRTFKIE